MKTLISGHRKLKLQYYDLDWIEEAIAEVIHKNYLGTIGLSGMADGIDLLFCEILLGFGGCYYAYIPFENQDQYMSKEDKARRKRLIDSAWDIYKVKNSQMVEDCTNGIIVWDGNKGGTYNVFQQMIEKKKEFWWIEPHNQKIIKV